MTEPHKLHFTLYDYFRSSACFRVRIALNIKEIDYESLTVHLVKDGGQHLQAAYRALNPQKLVPSLAIATSSNDSVILTQSLPIIEYMNECFPTPPLLPEDPIQRAEARAQAHIIASDIHPLNNLRVLNYLTHHLKLSDTQKQTWYHHWLAEGFHPIECRLATRPIHAHPYPTIADICLIPQVYNAKRFQFSLQDYPHIEKRYAHWMQHPAFIQAFPVE